ncbi:hypothetical protein ScPMuIL_007592 [Solemya velum]
MSTQQRLQQYLERNKIHSLFEDLMNKIAHEQPRDPIIFMIKTLYRKAGLDIPQELRLGGMKRTSPEQLGTYEVFGDMLSFTVVFNSVYNSHLLIEGTIFGFLKLYIC